MSNNPLDRQIGGNHYKNFAIQPIEFIHQNDIGFIAGCVIKRICRYNQPTGKGVEDLQKAMHEIEILIDQIGRFGLVVSLYHDRRALPIAPENFCWVNDFDKPQSAIITLVTLHNLQHDDNSGIADLRQAKDLAEQLLNTDVRITNE